MRESYEKKENTNELATATTENNGASVTELIKFQLKKKHRLL